MKYTCTMLTIFSFIKDVILLFYYEEGVKDGKLVSKDESNSKLFTILYYYNNILYFKIY